MAKKKPAGLPPPPPPDPPGPLNERIDRLVEKAEALADEGFPFDWDRTVDEIEQRIEANDLDGAEAALARAERLADRADRDWPLVLELLDRIDELHAIARECGVDVDRLLSGGQLTEGLLDQTAARASLALATIHDRLPRVLVAEAKTLGRSLQVARDRGEDVDAASRRLSAFLKGLRNGDLAEIGRTFLALRETIREFEVVPEVSGPDPEEEAQILLEARSLARRLRRMHEDGRYAENAARVTAQVHAALREGRSYATPMAEVDFLWSEVERLARERQDAEEPSALPADLAIPASELERTIEPPIAPSAPPEFLEAAGAPPAKPPSDEDASTHDRDPETGGRSADAEAPGDDASSPDDESAS
jgi:hypothetical protein